MHSIDSSESAYRSLVVANESFGEKVVVGSNDTIEKYLEAFEEATVTLPSNAHFVRSYTVAEGMPHNQAHIDALETPLYVAMKEHGYAEYAEYPGKADRVVQAAYAAGAFTCADALALGMRTITRSDRAHVFREKGPYVLKKVVERVTKLSMSHEGLNPERLALLYDDIRTASVAVALPSDRYATFADIGLQSGRVTIGDLLSEQRRKIIFAREEASRRLRAPRNEPPQQQAERRQQLVRQWLQMNGFIEHDLQPFAQKVNRLCAPRRHADRTRAIDEVQNWL